MDANTEDYLLLLLADGNLPTGSFVASSGLESFVTHGFFNSSHDLDSMINFVRDSVGSYARSALPFVSDTHKVVSRVVGNSTTNDAVTRIKALDHLYEAMTLNHVARRASKAQGVALLTLYSKGFSKPAFLSVQSDKSQQDRDTTMASLVERYKLLIRNEETHGHLPICWSLLTAALGLSLERCQYLHLFLHARSLLSASVRLNIIGPYASQQALLYAVRPIVEAELSKTKHLCTIIVRELEPESSFNEMTDGPATTWPLGEILASRHDLQHSRIFNS